jgi:hypothetical protein
MTMHEAVYFTDFYNENYKEKRKQIFQKLDDDDRHLINLKDVFSHYTKWQMYFSSTINRLEPFFDSTFDLMYGADEGIDFAKMITEGWVILVNLYSGLGVQPIHSRLLGTTVINEIIFALDRLREHGWKGVYYLYIDEAGRYANRNLADLLAYKRKSGLRVTIAHQYFKQFDDIYVLDSVKQLCKTKIMFNTPAYADRLEMVKALGYGGEISHEAANYANKNLPKQNMIIAKAKEPPVRVKVPDVPDIKVPGKSLTAFIESCLNNPWNKTPNEIRKEFDKRFNTKPPSKRARANSAAGGNPVWNQPASGAAASPKASSKRAKKS